MESTVAAPSNIAAFPLPEDKFLHLPDIDLTNPDVFETPDPPQQQPTTQHEHAPTVPDPNIETAPLPLDSAKSKFRASGVDASSADYSDSITSCAKTTFRTYNQTAYDTLLQDRVNAESPMQRLERLKAEVADLASTMSEPQPDKHAKFADAFAQLSALTAQLDALDPPSNTSQLITHIQAFQAQPPPKQPNGSSSITYNVYHAPATNAGGLAHLESRVDALERMVGVHQHDLVPNEPVSVMINRINRHLIYLANPRHLVALTRQLNTLLDKLRQLPAPDTSTAKTDVPYDLVQKIDPLLPVIPRVLDRLQSLHALHTDAARVTKTVAHLNDHVDRLDRSAAQSAKVLANVHAAVLANSEVAAKNVEALQAKIAHLTDRLVQLSQ